MKVLQQYLTATSTAWMRLWPGTLKPLSNGLPELLCSHAHFNPDLTWVESGFSI